MRDRYAIEIYRLERGELKRILHTISKEAYDSDKGTDSLFELGIKAEDQRNGYRESKTR